MKRLNPKHPPMDIAERTFDDEPAIKITQFEALK